jgi:hypothetical protein
VIEGHLNNLGLDYKPEIVDPDTFGKLEAYAKAFMKFANARA